MNKKIILIFCLYLLILYIFYNCLCMKNQEHVGMDYLNEKILVKANNIEIEELNVDELKLQNFLVDSQENNQLNHTQLNIRKLNEDVLKAIRDLPSIKPEYCLDGNCIDYNKNIIFKHFFPYGSIIPFKGKITNGPAPDYKVNFNVPIGWALCNGENNTPDLSNKFILGSSDNYNKDDTGGTPSFEIKKENLPLYEPFISNNPKHNENDIYYIMRIIDDREVVVDNVSDKQICFDSIKDDITLSNVQKLRKQLECLNINPLF